MSRIHYTKPSIGPLEISYATDAVRNGWGERCYEYITRFERAFEQHLGVRHAIATSSCTGAMHMGLAALGIGPGDEVILGDINWIASAAPITYLGAIPRFVDVLPESWCLDPSAVERAITRKTKAIIAVHLYGNLCEIDRLMEIGNRYGIPVVEDAAEAMGSCSKGRRAGSIGAFGTFSFHGTKTITTGEGGMFVTQDDQLFERVLTLSNHGRSKSQTKQFWPDAVGFKYKMSNVQAAIGCAQLERIDELLQRKREIFLTYQEGFKELPFTMNPEPQDCINGYWMPTLVANDGLAFHREDLLTRFRESDIDGRVFFWPLSMLPMFSAQRDNAVAYSLYSRAINLPSFHEMTNDDCQRVISVVRDHWRGASRP